MVPAPELETGRWLYLTNVYSPEAATLGYFAEGIRCAYFIMMSTIAFDDAKLRSRFDWLREPDPDAVATPPMFMAFDLLHEDGRELTGRPLRDRRARLESVAAGSEMVLPVRRLAKNGFEAWAEVIAHDYEGLVAKEEVSLYEAGPTRRWLKVKQRGWTDPEDRWQRRISTANRGR